MAIHKGHRANFETLRRACLDEHLTLMECVDKATGKPVMTLCAVEEFGGEFLFTPFAKMFDGNPYEELVAPMEEAT